jgi:hypothetical protein
MEQLIFPYGTADFYRIITTNNVYIDRTHYIPLLEKKGDTLIFLRPRRFGKSLLISMLENYYDVRKADAFDRLFGHLAIGQNPTPRHNRYFILRWNFSVVETAGDSTQVRQMLYDHLNSVMYDFSLQYEGMFKHSLEINPDNALATFRMLLALVRTTPYPLYLFIDEYDNFSNKVLMARRTDSQERYLDLVKGEGLLRTLFQTVKYALEGQGLERLFITGVSPVVVHDMTSSFNVAKDITFDPDLSELCGFSEAEIAHLLQQVGSLCAFSPLQVDEAMMMMQRFYNGYRFFPDQQTTLYNPMLIHYFLDHLQAQCQYPEEMLDSNLSMDRDKIAYAAAFPNGSQTIASILNEDELLVVSRLSQRFGIDDILYGEQEASFLESLLYYLGVLTSGGRTSLGRLRLIIPNLVVRGLYVDQMRLIMLPPGTSRSAAQVALDFFNYGNMDAVCRFIEQTYFTVLDNRDYRWTNELTIKMVFLTLLYSETFYIMDSEPALQRTYADLVMLVRPQMRQYQVLDFLLEFKYVSLTDLKVSGEQVHGMRSDELVALPQVAALLDEAQAKLAGYRETLIVTYGERLRLRCFSVVAIGYERLVWREMQG